MLLVMDDGIEVEGVVEGSSSAPAPGMDHIFSMLLINFLTGPGLIETAASCLPINIP
jgi:hypothetical protein